MHVESAGQGSPVWRVTLMFDRSPAEDNPMSLAPLPGPKALTLAALTELEALLRGADADPHCRVLVLGSEGTEFCRGMDLHGLARGVPYDAAIAAYARCLWLLRTIRPATVCVIESAATGGGVGLVAACDLVIASRGATFVLPELLLGLLPAALLPVLCERVGSGRARRLCLTGEVLHGAEAAQLGLVDQCVDDSQLALATILKHLLRISPVAVGRLKRHLGEIEGMPLEAALTAGAARTTADLQDPGVAAAIAGFVAGELPPWSIRYRVGGHS
jgi:enoyl-CoA hydratase/carnithine racemase